MPEERRVTIRGHKDDHLDDSTGVRPSLDGSLYKEKLEFSSREKWRILKNVTVISTAFTFLYTGFQGMMNIQSSINAEGGLGTISLAFIYGSLMVSCIFLPTIMIQRFTAKWTLVVTLMGYIPYIAAQFYPSFATLVPLAIVVGLFAAPMWASVSTYMTQLAQVYSKVVNRDTEAIIVRFFGFFFFALQTADGWGNLISSLILSSGDDSSDNITRVHDFPRKEKIRKCGADFCTSTADDIIKRPPDSEIFLITTIYLICIAMSVVMVAIFLDPLTRYGEKRHTSLSSSEQPSLKNLLLATYNQMKRLNQQLLIIITIFVGMQQAFMAAEFTQAFVTCALGVSMVGYVMVSFAVVNALSSMSFGFMMEYTGRIPIIAFGVVAHVAIILFSMVWKANPDQEYLFFVYSGYWGMLDALWQTQINGLYGSIFRRNKEAAFSNYRLWEAMGFTITLSTSTLFCIRTKSLILLSLLFFGTIGYGFVEYLHYKKAKRLSMLEAASSLEQRRHAEFLRAQSQSFDILDEIIDVIDDVSPSSTISHRSRFRKSIAFFIGSDRVNFQKDDRDTKSEGIPQRR